jgi:hypothetical protein
MRRAEDFIANKLEPFEEDGVCFMHTDGSCHVGRTSTLLHPNRMPMKSFLKGQTLGYNKIMKPFFCFRVSLS